MYCISLFKKLAICDDPKKKVLEMLLKNVKLTKIKNQRGQINNLTSTIWKAKELGKVQKKTSLELRG